MQLNNVFKDWLHSRKISDKIIEDFNLYSERDRLVIPIHDKDGIFSFNKYRRHPLSESGPKYTYDKGGSLSLFGLHNALGSDTVLWCEGELDALVAWSLNIPAVSGTGGAMSIAEDWRPFFAERQVILCFDNDEAGGRGMAKALEVAPHSKVVFLPDRPGIKDISDYVAQGGDLHALLKTAKHLSSMEDITEDRAHRVSIFQSTHFHDAFITAHTEKYATREPIVRDPLIKDRIERAKTYPIRSLLPFNSSDSTRCLWHAEKEASLHYYENSNKCWCFGGCGRGYDVIDVYRKLHNCSFKEAIEALQ